MRILILALCITLTAHAQQLSGDRALDELRARVEWLEVRLSALEQAARGKRRVPIPPPVPPPACVCSCGAVKP